MRYPDPFASEAAPWLTPEQGALCDYMADISEDCYCAGWNLGLEFVLWDAATTGEPMKWGLGEIDADDIAALRALSEKCGGWIRYESGHGPVFVPAQEWIAHAESGARRLLGEGR